MWRFNGEWPFRLYTMALYFNRETSVEPAARASNALTTAGMQDDPIDGNVIKLTILGVVGAPLAAPEVYPAPYKSYRFLPSNNGRGKQRPYICP